MLQFRNFPGGPVAKTLCPQCRGPGFNPWSGNWIPLATTETKYSQIDIIKKDVRAQRGTQQLSRSRQWYLHLRTSLIVQLVKNLPAMREIRVQFLGQEGPLEKDRLPTPVFLGFPCGSAPRTCLQCGRPGFDPWVGKIPWRREKLPIPVFWPGKFHGLCLWGHKEFRTEQLSLSSWQ